MASRLQTASGISRATWPGRSCLVGFVWALTLLMTGCQSRVRISDHPASMASVAKVGQSLPRTEPTGRLTQSVHAAIGCCQCHARAATDPASECQGTVDCVPCHREQARIYGESIHGVALGAGLPAAPRCPDCHGTHEIRKASDPAALTSKRLLPHTCGLCHATPPGLGKPALPGAESVRQYFLDTHGHSLLGDGLMVAPGCGDCHGASHRLQKASHPGSQVSRTQVPNTCGRCHTAILEQYRTSIHAEHARRGDPRSPVCTDCHRAHSVEQPSPAFVLASDQMCGKCHPDRMKQYRATYHGKAHELGVEGVATCFDCHQPHAVLHTDDPRSSLAVARRPQVCRQCHRGVSDEFATILAHGDARDAQSYPRLYWLDRTMMGILLGILLGSTIHGLLWFVRSLLERRGRSDGPGVASAAWTDAHPGVHQRFSAMVRFNHGLLAAGFFLQVVSGMPLKFHEAAWAKLLLSWLGGPRVAGGLHRIGAALIVVCMGLHLASVIQFLRQHRHQYRTEGGRLHWRKLAGVLVGPDSLLPNWQDVRDVWAHLTWLVRGGKRPDFDRFAYWEKFDYAATAVCLLVLTPTGLVMWFPDVTTRLFPGWVVNVAQLFHSDQALIAAVVAFVVHFYNVAFRPDRFPLDPVMFSGHVSDEQMRRERGRQIARIEALGAPPIADAEWIHWKPIVTFMGWLALVVGLALAAAIFAGLGAVLFG